MSGSRRQLPPGFTKAGKGTCKACGRPVSFVAREVALYDHEDPNLAGQCFKCVHDPDGKRVKEGPSD